MISQISSLPFFQSMAFGIIAMVVVGSSWCLTGFVMGDAPKRGIDASLVQFFGFAFAVVVGLAVLAATKAYPTCSPKVFWLTYGALALGYFMNFFGPSGIFVGNHYSTLFIPNLAII